MATHVSSIAKRVAAAHEAARKKTTKRRPSKKKSPSKKRTSLRTKKPSPPVAEEIPNTSDSVLDVGTEFSYNVSLSFIANMTGLPYLVVSERQIRDRLKQELRNAMVDAIKVTADSFDMHQPSIILTGVNIESAVNSG